ncbi:SDR family oxidoreductase [Sphingomonas solaris]|uniref:SDR family oxidoreductase n=2 Tax=Alterirhizorhabdus solaris TaxID=2529389 RepID=A0A558R3H0_9SPHN|nr:SDR family oxidoreductase [Sphingomonas solaris]
MLTRDAILLTGQVAIVTGGGGGIGRGIALGLAEFGADVAIVDIDGDAADRVAALVRARGQRALPIVADVMDRDAVRAAVARVAAELGRVDILVNNAAGTRPINLLEMTDRHVDRQIDINLKNLVATTQAAAKAMVAGGRGGSIVNIASIEGSRAAPGYSVYAACKAGMLNFTRSAALELAEHGIRVNTIAPDLVPTEHMARFAPAILSEAGKGAQARYIPLGRAGNLDDCAGAAVFLASAMAAYVTGVTIPVDGGTWASSGWTRDDEGGWKLFE